MDQIILDILENGLGQNPEQKWQPFMWKNLTNDLTTLIAKVNLTQEDTRPRTEWISTGKVTGFAKEIEGEPCICFADRLGAQYYATTHNVTKEKTVPVLISVEIDLSSVCIDGKDFLYTAIQRMNTQSKTVYEKQLAVLRKIYGPSINLYIEKILKDPDSDRIAVADLITNDRDIVIHHYNNQNMIDGRYGTRFRSAFHVRIPISRDNITGLDILKGTASLKADLSLHDYLEL
ncbi:MAG TPA: hypothetical protein VFW11_05755 [Cyclobacteriaceae bacterium]|nr:hypothetical protein [Cyclobacteriaceae bacterium]